MTARTHTPSFQPYTLTPLDHLLPPHHVFAYMSFRPEQPSEAVDALDTGLSDLISQWPFLAGNVARVEKENRRNVRELQPPTTSDLLRFPLLRVNHHQHTISDALASPVIDYEMLNVPKTLLDSNPIPAVRFQANVMQDGLILCLAWNHQVMDSLGVTIVLHALARSCSGRDRKSADARRLPMDHDKEEQARRRINQAATTSNPDLKDAYCETSYEEIRGRQPDSIICRRYTLHIDRVNYLKDSCNDLAHELAKGHSTSQKVSSTESRYKPENISSDDLVTALAWLSVSRARRRHASKHSSDLPRVSSLSRNIEVRSVLQPPLPRSYLGNSLVLAKSQCEWKDISTPREAPPVTRKQMDKETLNALLKLALMSRAKCKSLQDQQIRGLIGRVEECDDFSSVSGAPAEVIMSSLRKTDIYASDWGTNLGPLLDFDTIDGRTDGLTLILPDRNPARRGESNWEVRVNLPVEVMEEFGKDELLLWVTEGGKPGARL
ncbi:O-acetyltransferase [Aspergillus eucalypticola CBS 122712]|uniref:O-acetyltransferase n=1 Tax=Aspergillus eucalypticola (strain CBS 122712 / IBT 29274) TaxID=1448314 RepID=A0A317W3W7_ASPEC|nr:O-acetyltransferase [Aspergillus eucalypticola CBS 122712]PWY79818.1 O-acetyltransferase [Aspergillus eucalypticola CBS 122712]